MKKFSWPLKITAAFWLVILLFPPLRSLFVRHITGTPTIQFAVIPPQDLGEDILQSASTQFPNDMAIQVEAIDNVKKEEWYHFEYHTPYYDYDDRENEKPSKELLKKYDALLTKQPDNLWLISRRLRLTVQQYPRDRIGGELSDSDIFTKVRKGLPSPEFDQNVIPESSPTHIRETLALCRRAKKLEPNNAFFDFIEIYFLMTCWQDAQAWQVMQDATKKTVWNSYEQDDLRNSVKAREKLWGRALLLEEKQQILLTKVNLRQYSIYREMGRIIAWQGTKAKRQGNHAQALRIWSQFAMLSGKMAEQGRSVYEVLVGTALASIAVGQAGYSRNQYMPGAPRVRWQDRIVHFQKYARQHGRDDLARKLSTSKAAHLNYTTRLKNSMHATPSMELDLSGISLLHRILIRSLWILSVLTLIVLPVPLLAWLFLSGATIRRDFRRTLQLDAKRQQPTRREVILSIFGATGIRTFLVSLALLFLLVPSYTMLLFTTGTQGNFLYNLNEWINDTFPVGDHLLNDTVLQILAYKRFGHLPMATALVITLALTPLLFAIIQIAQQTLHRQTLRCGARDFRLRPWVTSLFRKGERPDFDVASLVKRVLDWGVVATIFSSWFLIVQGLLAHSTDNFMNAIINDVTSLLSYILLTALAVFCVLRWRQWFAGRERRDTMRYGFLLARKTMGGWVFAGTILYFTLLVASVFVRSDAERRIDNIFKHGEAAAVFMK